MDDFMKECFIEAFSKTNIDDIWKNRTSKTDILPIETDLPIRNKLNDVGTRNIEIMLQSPFGLMYKTLGLVENDQIIIPNEFNSLKSQVDFGNFKTFNFKREIDIMIGAFSMDSLLQAVGNEDVDLYKANGIDFEMVKAFDGTMQTFTKEKEGLDFFNPLTRLQQTELDGNPVSAFKLRSQPSGVFPTNNSHQWLDRLAPQRLMAIFTMEQ
ncbi:MAG: hypothetical protein CMH48_12645 [Muricauda sp.]|nr:hypothetical protein [Allomuricauda sp.]MBC31677.1 hypothetical protein [Allomuricauda sp.]MCB0463386.1 hypothetical protein [Flavobacteriaceae bacterium]|tara:strand:+ start:168 stop:800 length:633 start_codon:yes stop_codon:yes gene_type:complete